MMPPRDFAYFSLTMRLAVLAAVILSGCSFPKIVVLHDPLTAAEHDELGRIYESQKNYDLARAQYREALERDRKHLPSLLLLGDLSYRQGDYGEAESAYTKALRLDPENADVRNNLAWALIKTGKELDRARTLVAKALEQNPPHRSFYLDTLGVILLRLGNVTEAIAVLKESLDSLPRDRPEILAEAEGHLAEAYKAAGYEQEYAETLKRRQELMK